MGIYRKTVRRNFEGVAAVGTAVETIFQQILSSIARIMIAGIWVTNSRIALLHLFVAII